MTAAPFSAIAIDRQGFSRHGDTGKLVAEELHEAIGARLRDSKRSHDLPGILHAAPTGWRGRGWVFVVPAARLGPDWRSVVGIAPDLTQPNALLVRFDAEWWEQAIDSCAEAYGLSPLESSLLSELIDHGQLGLAIDSLGIGRTAARNALVRLRRKAGVRSLPELILQTLTLMTQPSGMVQDDPDEFLATMLEVPPAHFAVLRGLVEGRQRKQVAAETGRSLSSIKAIQAKVFAGFDIQSTRELAALLGQARYVAEQLLRASEDDKEYLAKSVAREWRAPDGRRVGYSLYGDGSGPVAAILHSTITCRHPPMRFVRALLRDGWRVLAIDRPGFGDTDEALDPGIDAHIKCAANDMIGIARTEQIVTATVVARGSGHIAIAIANLAGSLVKRVMLVNPTPPPAHSPADRGPLGAVKRRFASNPASIRLMIRLLTRLATPKRLESAMHRAFAGSPPDLAGLEDPLMVSDYLRATMPLGANLEGYVTENSAWARNWEARPERRDVSFTILFGSAFVLHETGAARGYFTQLLPGAAIRTVRGAGQMLMYTHWHEVVACLVDGESG